jgi:rhamnosyltransferase
LEGVLPTEEQGSMSPTVEVNSPPRAVWAVIVAYHPDTPALCGMCKRLLGDGATVVVIDNTEMPRLESTDLPAGARLHRLGSNTGIAHAQNVGIATALSAGADVVVFFDQDSTFSPGFLSVLLSALRPGIPDVVAPLCVDTQSREELPSQRLAPFGRTRPVYGCGTSEPSPTDIVISSGTAVTREGIALAGQFDEDLFIDFVDTEWCLRCRSRKIPIRVVPGAVLHQRIGGRSIVDGPFTILTHSPARCYYQIRNSVHLFRRRHVPRLFAAREMVSVLMNRLLLLRHVDDRIGYLRAYAQGLRDGLFGVVGARPVH